MNSSPSSPALFLKNHLAEYFITEAGVVLKDRLTEVKSRDNGLGYLAVRLTTEVGKKKTFKIHQLVAKAFIPNPLGLPEVNHIDGNKLDCSKGNLEWATERYNGLHAHKIGLHGAKTSRHYGVYWYERKGQKPKWRAAVVVGGKKRSLGHHDEEDDAGRAVNAFIVSEKLSVPLNVFEVL